MFRGLCENTTAIERVIDDFAHCGCIRINVHSIASSEMSNNTFSGYIKCHSGQLRIATRLNVIDPLEPLLQRQVSIKGHDCVSSSIIKFFCPCCLDALLNKRDAAREHTNDPFEPRIPAYRSKLFLGIVQQNRGLYRRKSQKSIILFVTFALCHYLS